MADDIGILRGLVRDYLAICAQPRFAENRELWRAHNSLKPTRPMIFIQNFGLWMRWCNEFWNERTLVCKDPFFRDHEAALRIEMFEAGFGDDRVCKPWLSQGMRHILPEGGTWGMNPTVIRSHLTGGAFKQVPPLTDWADMKKLRVPHHQIDESSQADVQRLRDAVGDLIEIDVQRGPVLAWHGASISEPLCALRGIEQVMMDMYDCPGELHRLLSFLRDGTLTNHQEAEDAGDWSPTVQCNQAEIYSEETDDPAPNARGKKRNRLYGYCQAQELTLVSPKMHEEFMLRYQMPIMEKFGLMAYGCCEDLSCKIEILRQIPNLRQIAVSPVANLAQCAEQIGPHYIVSWRPNPSLMVCCGFDEARIRSHIREGLKILKANDCRVHINLKDVQTLEGDLDRLRRWTVIVRSVIDEVW